MPKYKSLRVSPVFSKSTTVHLYEFLFMSDIRLNLSPHMLRGTDSHLCTSWYSLCGSSWVFSILFVIVLNIFSHWFLQRCSFSDALSSHYYVWMLSHTFWKYMTSLMWTWTFLPDTTISFSLFTLILWLFAVVTHGAQHHLLYRSMYETLSLDYFTTWVNQVIMKYWLNSIDNK